MTAGIGAKLKCDGWTDGLTCGRTDRHESEIVIKILNWFYYSEDFILIKLVLLKDSVKKIKNSDIKSLFPYSNFELLCTSIQPFLFFQHTNKILCVVIQDPKDDNWLGHLFNDYSSRTHNK